MLDTDSTQAALLQPWERLRRDMCDGPQSLFSTLEGKTLIWALSGTGTAVDAEAVDILRNKGLVVPFGPTLDPENPQCLVLHSGDPEQPLCGASKATDCDKSCAAPLWCPACLPQNLRHAARWATINYIGPRPCLEE